MTYHDKRLIGGSGEINNLMPAKYQWAWDMVMKSIANTWFHHEVSMVRDKADFDTALNPVEKETFLNVFATLTTSDIAILRNVAASIMRHITAPEVELYLATQIAEERVHTVAYQHVIEILCLDEASIYSRYLTIPEIKQKFDYANTMSDKIDKFENAESFLEGLFFYYMVFEGIWFYNGFSPIYSLGRRNILPGTTTQLQMIMRDESNHVAFGVKLLRGVFEENMRLSQDKAHAIMAEGIRLEEAYAKRTIGAMLGYNPDTHIEQARYLANRRLNQLGYDILYPEATCVLPWLDEMVNINKEKNFFETRVTEYQSAASLDGTWD